MVFSVAGKRIGVFKVPYFDVWGSFASQTLER